MSLYERVDGVADAPAATPAPSFAEELRSYVAGAPAATPAPSFTGAAADGIQA